MINGTDLQKCEKQVEEIVTEFCIEVIQNPLCYFSEADLQLMLAEALRRYPPFKKPVSTAVRRGAHSKGTYGTPLLHREYGGGEGTRIDIVILNPDEVQQIDDPNLTIKGKYLHPLYAFELGTEKSQDAAGHLESDFGKLQRIGVNKGFIIHFFKDTTLARTGTLSRNKTEDRINRIFRQAFALRNSQCHEKIKILAILLRTGRNQPGIRGKCEIFDGKKWVKVNVSRVDSIRDKLMEQLR